ncbi:FKBP-type peptidyl-prolyl cis-trans isomerase [Thalassotalea euphylliae]|uniref:Peptidyl-prolyl cis-trans isomerase n=1 Tax=Thalassotalea euphylliae TaxID=1655234 RepID=A0A3E0TN34_9GAMM|nr:FKBP-type peptidyl-prolyl cis-trans isomerase [Thalassotalea euphylliae]REL26001.1 FKBP-type peptidyl-prolyl cis-trans isomerase [Thalassotalea euphylliae]
MTQITADSSLVAHITMKLSDGSAADSTKVNNKPAIINMGDQSISPAFEAQLLGMQAGESKEFTLAAKDAFGEKNPDNVHYVDINKFDADTPAKVGSIITFTTPGGEVPGMVTEVSGASVTVDFNHPLAGQDVTFVIDVVEIK